MRSSGVAGSAAGAGASGITGASADRSAAFGRADARLEALFSTVVAIGDFEFVQFEEVTNLIETRDFLLHDIRMQISFKGPRIASLKDTGAYHWEMRNSSM